MLKFVDLVNGKSCKSQRRGNENLNSCIFEETTRPDCIKNAISLDVCHTTPNFQNFKGRGHEKISSGASPRTPFSSLHSHLVLAPPPNMNFVPTGLLI